MPTDEDPPVYTKYRARGVGRAAQPATVDELRSGGRPPSRWARLRQNPVTPGRVAAYLAAVVVGWIVLSLAAFVLSATLHQDAFHDTALDGGGTPPFTASTVLVLGTDQRPKNSKEPGADPNGPRRADSIMLLRIGGGRNAKLSIPRDTAVPIAGHGTQKINAALAFGGEKLMVSTVESFLGIGVDHLVEIDFTNFPKLIDAMGGIDYTGGCVKDKVNGGYKNGGVTVHLKSGTTHIDGSTALALARVRKNSCNPRENDLTRARRQQKLLAAMKGRALSLNGFLRGPSIGWNAPRAIKTDMAGPSLLGVATAMGVTGSGDTRVLRPNGGVQLPDGEDALTISSARVHAAVRRFLGN